MARDRKPTDFSATALGELAISMPIRPRSLLEVELSFAMPTSCMKLAVASLLRSYIIKVSLAGIFARRFLAIGYPEEGTRPFVSTIHLREGYSVEDKVGLPRAIRRREAQAHPFVQDL